VAADPALDQSLRALGDANRRVILAVIRSRPQPVGEIAHKAGLSQQAASHHLRVLRTAGLVTETRDGTRHPFAVNTDGFEAVRAYLDDFRPTKLAACGQPSRRDGVMPMAQYATSIEIEASPQEVFESLVTSARMTAWLGQRAVLDPCLDPDRTRHRDRPTPQRAT